MGRPCASQIEVDGPIEPMVAELNVCDTGHAEQPIPPAVGEAGAREEIPLVALEDEPERPDPNGLAPVGEHGLARFSHRGRHVPQRRRGLGRDEPMGGLDQYAIAHHSRRRLTGLLHGWQQGAVGGGHIEPELLGDGRHDRKQHSARFVGIESVQAGDPVRRVDQAVGRACGPAPPTQTVIGVAGLAMPDILFEVEAIAVRP